LIVFVNWLILGDDVRDSIWSDKGLSNDAWFILLGNTFIGPMSNFFNPFHLLRWVKRKTIIREGKNCHLTQKEANYWFEGPPFDIAQRYANHTKTMMISLYFLPLFPLALPIGIVSIYTAHLTEKYLLFYRHAAPKATGPALNFEMYRFFDIVMIIFSVCFFLLMIF
jgi:hypothetical protein